MNKKSDEGKYLISFFLLVIAALLIVIGFVALVPQAEAADIELVATNQDSCGAGCTSLTYSITTTGTNRFLLVNNYSTNANEDPTTGITYNGDPLTKIESVASSSLSGGLWYLINPDTGTHDIVVSMSVNRYYSSAAASFSHVRQTQSFSANTSNFGDGVTGVNINLPTVSSSQTIVISGYDGNAHFQTSTGLTVYSDNLDEADRLNGYVGKFVPNPTTTITTVPISATGFLLVQGMSLRQDDETPPVPPASSTASIQIFAPVAGNYQDPFHTNIVINVSSTYDGVIEIRSQNNTSTTIRTIGLSSPGMYSFPATYDNHLWAIWATFKGTGYETSTSNIVQFDVGGNSQFSTSTGRFSNQPEYIASVCDNVGNATSSGFFSIAATDFRNGISRGLCEVAIFLFVPGQISVPQLDLQYRIPFNQIYALYDIAQSLIDTPTSTQTFGIIIPTLPRPATTTIFSFNTNEMATGIGADFLETAAPYVTMMLYLCMILYAMAWTWIIVIMLN